MKKKIRTIILVANAATKPENLFSYCLEHDSDPLVETDLDMSPETLKAAQDWLRDKRSYYRRGRAVVWAVEYYTANDDGDFIDGSDFDTAPEEGTMTIYGRAINQEDMDLIASYMDDDLREELHADLAPCTPEEFITAYLERDPDFLDLLQDTFEFRRT